MTDNKYDGGPMDQILSVNKLKFVLPTNLSVVNKRTQKINFADSQNYSSSSGSEVVFRLQASTDYVYPRNCYLRMDVKATYADGDAATRLGFVSSPATALFQRVLIEDKSGSELDRIDNLNIKVKTADCYNDDPSYRNILPMTGYFPNPEGAEFPSSSVSGANTLKYSIGSALAGATSTSLRVCIPMWMISKFYDSDQLMPSSLVSGQIVRLTLAPAVQAISSIITAPVDVTSLAYTITDPVIIVDSYELAPMVSKNLLEQSGNRGLDYVYTATFLQSSNVGASLSYVQQVNKAVSRALALKSVTQSNEPAGAPNGTRDSLGSIPYSYARLQYRIGDIYLPQQELQSGVDQTTIVAVQKNCAEIYGNNLLYTKQMQQSKCAPLVQFEEFRGDYESTKLVASTANGSRVALIENLEKNAVLEQDGLSVNNSRTLEMRVSYAGNQAGSKTLYSWLEYVKIAKIFPMRSVIKE